MDNIRQLPESVRVHLATLAAAAQQARAQLDSAIHVTCSFLEIDPTWPNHIDLPTGMVYLAADAKTPPILPAHPPANSPAAPPVALPFPPWTVN